MTIEAPLDARPAAVPPAAVNSLLTSPILPTLLKLAIPNTIAMFGTTLVAVAETSYIGRLGTEPLAGIALVFPFVMLTQMMSAGAMGGGVSSAISRAIGAGDRDRAATLALHAAMIGACAGIFFTVMMLAFGRAFYTLLGGRGGVLEQAMQYSQVLFSGAVAIWLVNTLASVMRGTGDMRMPSVTLIGTALVQIAVGGALGLGLFGLPKLGMRGVAAGQLTAFTLGAIFLAWYLDRRPQPADAEFQRLQISARHVLRHSQGRRGLLPVAAANRADHLDLHQNPRRLRHRDAGRLRHGLAAGILADPDRVRVRRRLGADGRHGDGRGPCDARAAGGVDRGRRGRHHRRRDRPDRRSSIRRCGSRCSPAIPASPPPRIAISPGPARHSPSSGWARASISPRKVRQRSAGPCWPAPHGCCWSAAAAGGWPRWARRPGPCLRWSARAMVVYGLGTALSVRLTRWGK